ncbi:MAG: YqaA family protein [Thiohalomonadales bacterium]
MKFFSAAYDRAMVWAVHRYAQWYLGALSFAEACVLPFPPPDVMLAPMSLAQPRRAWWFATLTTVLSVLGGLAGYAIGHFAFDIVQPWIVQIGYAEKYQTAVDWFEVWGIWVVLLAGFSPIPYKVFTIAAGVASMALLPFVFASLAGRGARFFLVAGLMVLGGEKMDQVLRKYVDRLGWIIVAAVVVVFGLVKLLA